MTEKHTTSEKCVDLIHHAFKFDTHNYQGPTTCT